MSIFVRMRGVHKNGGFGVRHCVISATYDYRHRNETCPELERLFSH